MKTNNYELHKNYVRCDCGRPMHRDNQFFQNVGECEMCHFLGDEVKYDKSKETLCVTCTAYNCKGCKYNEEEEDVLFEASGGDHEYHMTELFGFFHTKGLVHRSTFDKCWFTNEWNELEVNVTSMMYIIDNIMEKNKDKLRIEGFSCNDEDGSVGVRLIRL